MKRTSCMYSLVFQPTLQYFFLFFFLLLSLPSNHTDVEISNSARTSTNPQNSGQAFVSFGSSINLTYRSSSERCVEISETDPLLSFCTGSVTDTHGTSVNHESKFVCRKSWLHRIHYELQELRNLFTDSSAPMLLLNNLLMTVFDLRLRSCKTDLTESEACEIESETKDEVMF